MVDTLTAPDPIAERFARESAKHEMTILHDDGLYRHLRFVAPGDSAYWYDLITVPGSLIFRGDGESFVFAREKDMFDFFRRSSWHGGPNPTYWDGKLTSSREAAKTYSERLFKQYVAEYIEDAKDDYPGLFAAWDAFIAEGWHSTEFEDGARAALDEFEFAPDFAKHGPFRFTDTWEWDLKEHDWWFLWACHAIVAGITRYDQATAAGSAGSGA